MSDPAESPTPTEYLDGTALSAVRFFEGRDEFDQFSVAHLTPEKVQRFLSACADQDLIREWRNPTTGEWQLTHGYMVLDVLAPNGDIVDDWMIPTEAAWRALNSELRLELVGGPSL